MVDTISLCIESVRSQQSHTVNVSHWVQDGDSSDGIIKILSEQDFSNWESGKDRGQAHAINLGFKRGDADILAYLNTDDFYVEGALEKVAQVFRDHEEVDVVYGDYFFEEGTSGWRRLKKAWLFSTERLKRHNFISQPATFWRSRVMDQFGDFDERWNFCMDHEFWLRIVDKIRWYYLPEPLAVMGVFEGTKTVSQLRPAWAEVYEMVSEKGLSHHFYWRCLWMQSFGKWVYAWKRGTFNLIGHLRKKVGQSEV